MTTPEKRTAGSTSYSTPRQNNTRATEYPSPRGRESSKLNGCIRPVQASCTGHIGRSGGTKTKTLKAHAVWRRDAGGGAVGNQRQQQERGKNYTRRTASRNWGRHLQYSIKCSVAASQSPHAIYILICFAMLCDAKNAAASSDSS